MKLTPEQVVEGLNRNVMGWMVQGKKTPQAEAFEAMSATVSELIAENKRLREENERLKSCIEKMSMQKL